MDKMKNYLDLVSQPFSQQVNEVCPSVSEKQLIVLFMIKLKLSNEVKSRILNNLHPLLWTWQFHSA